MSGGNGSLVSVRNLKKYFPIVRGTIIQRHVGDCKAVDDVSFDILKGETLGLVGETGCGKTTVGRTILRLYEPTDGEIIFGGTNLTDMTGGDLRRMRRKMQMIFQDPYASLNPRMTVGSIIAAPLEVHKVVSGKEKHERVQELLQMVGLNPYFVNRYPHEFSGGQRQRIGIARALALHPRLIFCDEPVSALDVSIQAQTLNLLQDLQADFDLAYVFVAHDLSVVQHISDRVAVMYVGKIAELTDSDTLYNNPLHPYTEALMSSVPKPDPKYESKRIIMPGDVADPSNPPPGCYFHPRCRYAKDICSQKEPEFRELKPDHFVSCHRAEELQLKGV